MDNHVGSPATIKEMDIQTIENLKMQDKNT